MPPKKVTAIQPPAYPSPPDWLDEAATEVWDGLAPTLQARGLLEESDRETFAILCSTIVQHRQAASLIARSSVLVKGDKGNLVKNPALQIARDTAQTIRSYAQEFGLTPTARATMGIAAVSEVDKALSWLEKRKVQ